MAKTYAYSKAEADAKFRGGITLDPVITPVQEAVDGTGSDGINAATITVSELYALWDDLVSQYPEYLTQENLGLDASGTYQLRKIRFKLPESTTIVSSITSPSLKRVFIVSSLHGHGNSTDPLGDGSNGDSKDNSIILYRFIKDLLDRDVWVSRADLMFIRQNYEFIIIPCGNPWGFDNYSRYNSNGVDLNRDFVSFSQVESVLIRDEIVSEQQSESRINFLIDMHSLGVNGWPGQMIGYGASGLGDEISSLVIAFLREAYERPKAYSSKGSAFSGLAGWASTIGIPFSFTSEFARKHVSGGDDYTSEAVTFNYNMLVSIFMIK